MTETSAIDLSSGPTHFRVELNPGVTVSNTIGATWFTGDTTLLTIVGTGSHIEDTTSGLSSRIILESGQALRPGTDAELNIRDMRISGSGSNTFTSGTSTIENCRFDTSLIPLILMDL